MIFFFLFSKGSEHAETSPPTFQVQNEKQASEQGASMQREETEYVGLNHPLESQFIRETTSQNKSKTVQKRQHKVFISKQF